MNYVLTPTQNDIFHSGKGHDDNPPGRGSGRYPYGSGKRPHQDKEQRKINKIVKKTDKSINNIEKKRNETLKTRDKNRSKIENKYNKKISRTMNEYKRIGLEGARDEKLKDFDNGTNIINTSFSIYSNIIKDYRDMKVSEIKKKDIRNSVKYKEVMAKYMNQAMSDIYVGKAGTILNYANDVANQRHKWTTRSTDISIKKRKQ